MTAKYDPAEADRLIEAARSYKWFSDDAIDSMADQLEAAKAEVDLLNGHLRSRTEHARLRAKGDHERAEALRAALREACAMLLGCRTGDNQPPITTSKIDTLLAVANGDNPLFEIGGTKEPREP